MTGVDTVDASVISVSASDSDCLLSTNSIISSNMEISNTGPLPGMDASTAMLSDIDSSSAMLLDLGSSSAVALDHDSSGVDSVDDSSRDNGDKHCIVVPIRGWATKS